MKRLLAGAAWALLFAALGAAALPLLGFARLHHLPKLDAQLLSAGLEFTLDLYLFLLFFALLPGTRRAGPPPPLGVPQAVWSLAGFLAMVVAGSLASYNILIAANLALTAAQAGWHADLTGSDALLASILGGEAAAALWISWYLGQAGPAQLASGAAAGVAWRAASPAAYRTAAFCAAAILAMVVALLRFLPPDPRALDDLPAAKLLAGGGWELLPMLAVVVFIGPVLEEITFRGIAFAGFARRFGPLWASVITTVVFMAFHAGEKWHYPPGFIDVGLMAAAACWLRLKYASIRPGILLHILYNGGLLLAGGIFQ